MNDDDNDGFYEPGRAEGYGGRYPGYHGGAGYTHRDKMKRPPWWHRFLKKTNDDDDDPPLPRRG